MKEVEKITKKVHWTKLDLKWKNWKMSKDRKFQLLNGQKRVKCLLQNIACSDAGFQATISLLCDNDRPDEKLNYWKNSYLCLMIK